MIGSNLERNTLAQLPGRKGKTLIWSETQEKNTHPKY